MKDAAIEPQILRANRAFYAAFAAGDIEAMDELWAHNTPVACTHPGWPAQHGREDVMASWRAILLGGGAQKIRIEDEHAFAMGDAGYVTCIEHFRDAVLAATNFFVREDGLWHVIHHQAGPITPTGDPPAERILN